LLDKLNQVADGGGDKPATVAATQTEPNLWFYVNDCDGNKIVVVDLDEY
jgi:hypothetical protein